jgi:hypothetical protein
MARQVSDEMRARIIIWRDEQHLSPQEIGVPRDISIYPCHGTT